MKKAADGGGLLSAHVSLERFDKVDVHAVLVAGEEALGLQPVVAFGAGLTYA